MNILPVVGYDDVNKEHRPLADGEVVPPRCVPVSSYPGNSLAAKDDGLYYGGNSMPPLLYIDTELGVDAELSPTGEPSVLKTLDYALSKVEASQPKSVTLLLKAGQTFYLTANRKISNTQLTIAYYGDPKYGNYTDVYSSSRIRPRYLADLARPIIRSSPYQSASGYWSCWRFILDTSKLSFIGLRLEICERPLGGSNLQDNHYSAGSDLVVGFESTVSIDGVIVNKADAGAYYGFLGVGSRSRSRIEQLGSQFLVSGARVTSTVNDVTRLVGRKSFIKFYPDLSSSDSLTEENGLVPTSNGPVEGCGLLELMWLTNSIVSDPISNSSTLGSWPLVDYTYGIANYFYNISRDNQKRPLNVISSILL